MSAARELAARLLGHGAGYMGAPHGDWAAAALAELPAIERPADALAWTLGTGGMIVRDLLVQTFLPWRRDPNRRPPSGFAAMIGLILLAGPAWMAANGGPFPIPAMAAAGVGVMLALWANAGVIFRVQHLEGLLYTLGMRLAPLNLAVSALAIAIGGALI